MTEGMKTVLNRDTLVPISVVAAIAVMGGPALFYLARIDTKVNTLMADKWGATRQSEWSLRLQLANPDIDIPDPRDPSRSLRKP